MHLAFMDVGDPENLEQVVAHVQIPGLFVIRYLRMSAC